MTPVSGRLAELAAMHGVAVEYWDQGGSHRSVSGDTVVAVLAALGVDAGDDAAVDKALGDAQLRDWRRVLPPVFVTRSGIATSTWVHVPHGTAVRCWVEFEGGGGVDLDQVEHLVAPQHVDDTLVGEATFAVPHDLPWGYHRLTAEHADPRDHGLVRRTTVPLIVTPARLTPPSGLDRRSWGPMVQLYSLRSRRSWGLGDLTDLADLATWAAVRHHADWVLVNPLHASSPVAPMAPSPYLPATRRFANPIYARVEAIPEYAYLPPAARMRVEVLAGGVRPLDDSADLLDRDAVWAAKSAALQVIYDAGLSPGRRAALDAYRAHEGPGLLDFATWCALAEDVGHGEWPAQWRDPRSPDVTAARERLADRVEFFVWCQWVIDEQLSSAQSAARAAGMGAGIVHDLAVGVHPEGADAWALAGVLATGVSVGAPPDMYNQKGQDWSQPPWRPDALAEAGFAPYRDMLRTILRHAGGIRVDHVLGLFRLWWIPRGADADQGTYVRYDHEALVGILALEAHRAGAFVVGEDLGTVEQWVQDLLRDRGIAGTSVLWFEADDDGAPLPPEQWRHDVMASVTVHDLPPTAGFLAGEHIRIRSSLDLLTRSVAEEQADLATTIAGWDAILRDRGLMADGEVGVRERVLGLHRAVAASGARFVGVALPDAVGDVRAQNQPGTDQEYPNWRIPLCDGDGRAVLLEDLATDPGVAEVLATVSQVVTG